MTDNMTKTERGELRSIVKQQFKVLRSELDQRAAELVADVDRSILERFSDLDRARERLTLDMDDMAARWNDELRDHLRKNNDHGFIKGYSPPRPPHIEFAADRRTEMRRAAVAKIEADVRGAKLRLEREEADLLRTLAVGALESDAARGFLAGIPTVGELVPTARLAELEASLGDMSPEALIDHEHLLNFRAEPGAVAIGTDDEEPDDDPEDDEG